MAQIIYTYKVEILNLKKKKRNILSWVSDRMKNIIYDLVYIKFL